MARMEARHWRAVLYAATLIVQAVVAYLADKGLVGSPEVTLSATVTGIVLAVAGYKAVRPDVTR